MEGTAPLVTCRSLVKVYRIGDGEVLALQGLDLDVAAGELVGVVGASGSGKSTLLTLLGGLGTPTAGSIEVGGLDLVNCGALRRDRYRREQVGFVWQHSHQNLLADLDAVENVALPLVRAGRRRPLRRATELLDMVGLGDRLRSRPARLSGGEQARVGLAVALALEPQLLLADEPTGELDRATTEDMFALMRRVSAEEGVAQVIVSHDDDLVGYVDRVIGIRDGRTATESMRVGATSEPAGSGDGSGPPVATDHGSEHVRDVVAHMLVVDAVGRVQLPAEIIDALGIAGRVSADIVDGHARLRPIDVETGMPRIAGTLDGGDS